MDDIKVISVREFWYMARDYWDNEIDVKGVGPALVRSSNLETGRRALMKIIIKDIDAWKKWNRGGSRVTLEVM